MVYKPFPGIRRELRGDVLDGFDLFFEECSLKFPDEFSVEEGKPRVGLRNQGISMIPGSEPILVDLEKLFLLSEEQISKE